MFHVECFIQMHISYYFFLKIYPSYVLSQYFLVRHVYTHTFNLHQRFSLTYHTSFSISSSIRCSILLLIQCLICSQDRNRTCVYRVHSLTHEVRVTISLIYDCVTIPPPDYLSILLDSNQLTRLIFGSALTRRYKSHCVLPHKLRMVVVVKTGFEPVKLMCGFRTSTL